MEGDIVPPSKCLRVNLNGSKTEETSTVLKAVKDQEKARRVI